ncbi:MAG: winged helix-turn-helix domain-containing protein, partial [Rhodoferax sp.]|nr:winged helix-turn-helix domain-containing protein [Rhodoferax sp.]
MGLLQIDTIHVVARSPYLVLFSRLGAYPQSWLDEALARGEVFETWAHEACFAPMEDLLAHRVYNCEARKHWGLAHAQKSHAKQRAELDQLLLHIRDKGPVKSSDFERADGEGSAWWGWKDEKRWLEALFATGELMVARRERFQRVYDLAERVAPQLAGSSDTPAVAQVQQRFVEQSVVALGITQARWINDYYRSKPRLKDADLDALVEQGALLRVHVQGWKLPAYVHSSQATLLKKAQANTLEATHSALLSPFDPIVWDRERALTLFDFDYRLECYTPEAKRIHGYFVLPILCRGKLIGRLDAKAHRADGVFEVRALHVQAGAAWTEQQIADVAQAIQRCAHWHATLNVTIKATHPAKLAVALRRALRATSQESALK